MTHSNSSSWNFFNDSLKFLQRRFKTICDQLPAIGQLVANIDKVHWFLYGLGASCETFSTTILATKPTPGFHDLLSQTENHEMFLKLLHGFSHSPVAFNA